MQIYACGCWKAVAFQSDSPQVFSTSDSAENCFSYILYFNINLKSKYQCYWRPNCGSYPWNLCLSWERGKCICSYSMSGLQLEEAAWQRVFKWLFWCCKCSLKVQLCLLRLAWISSDWGGPPELFVQVQNTHSFSQSLLSTDFSRQPRTERESIPDWHFYQGWEFK